MTESNKNIKNFSIKLPDGRTEWISRSIVCSCAVYGKYGDELYILMTQRGPHASASGQWCVPGGYLDYNETLEECAVREVYEETGIKIDPSRLERIYIDSTPKGRKQNVIIKFMYKDYLDIKDNVPNMNHMEPDELMDVRWINIKELNNYNLAFK